MLLLVVITVKAITCNPVQNVASRISEGFCMLSEGFKLAFPKQVYKSDMILPCNIFYKCPLHRYV